MEIMGIGLIAPVAGVFKDKKILVTGHTGFKGSWLSLWLHNMGAEVIGYALPCERLIDNFALCGLTDKIINIQGDVRDKEHLQQVFNLYQPELVFHLAAQSLVRLSYQQPADTFETNISGTVNVLESMRNSDSVHVGVIITSDKCYENKEQLWGYREGDPLGGFDPYSASKGCAEIITAAYRNSFFSAGEKALSSVRAGNVIGGGDWSPDRIIPDCIRALRDQQEIQIRNPDSVRPWQFVLEPLYGYLLLASKMLEASQKYSGAWNFGPDFASVVPVKEMVNRLISIWGSGKWTDLSRALSVHEAELLSLDCTKAKTMLGWRPKLSLEQTLERTAHWYKEFETSNVYDLCVEQISDYCALQI